MNKKVVFLIYDADTAIACNNEGALVFDYNLEDIDQTAAGADIFNGQQSVLWKNMRAAFFEEMRTMYQNLRSTGKLSYEKVEQMFEEHQSKWPEAIFNEDAWFKYLAPLVEKGNASYLSMLQGSKTEQRKFWLYNRFRYIDSKYNAGDALTDVITVRGYAKADITVTPYADIYPTVKYGSYLVQQRGARNVPSTLACPLDNVNDTEIMIFSASQLADVGDLSGLKVGFADFSKATRLQSLKIGDSDSNYSNGNLTELYVGNSELLRMVDVRNCPNLAQAVDLSGCKNIEHIYFDGTAITGLDLPKGGIIKTLRLPGTLVNLSIIGHSGITGFVLPDASHLTTCRLENVGTGIGTKSILNNLTAGCRVRLIGFDWTVSNETELLTLKAKLDTMRGLNESGGNEETAQLMGTVRISSVTGATLNLLNQTYPDITVIYQNISSKCYYWNYNGTSLLYTATATNGGNVSYHGSTPAKPSTESHTFTFIGWAKTMDAEAVDPAAQTGIVKDRNLYPVFSAVIRTYTVTWYVGNTAILTKTGVEYGSSVSYDGETPANIAESDPADWQFTGWDAEAADVRSNLQIHAQFRYVGYMYKHLLDGNLKGEYSNSHVTSLGTRAFYQMTQLTKITCTEATSVGSYAFSGCRALREVSLPKAVTLSERAFDNVTSLQTINIPLVEIIGEYTFYSCSGLTNVAIPKVTVLPQYVFSYCRGLRTLNMQRVTSIGKDALSYCSGLTEIDLPETLTVIGQYAFRYCSGLTKVVIPSAVTRVSDNAFDYCTNLTKAVFMGKPNSMYSNIFRGCTKLTDIYVPWSYGEVAGDPWGAENAAIHYVEEGWMENLGTILA